MFQIVTDQATGAAEQELMVELARRTGGTVTYALAQAPYAPDGVPATRWRTPMRYAADGIDLVPQVSVRPTGMLFGLQSSLHPFITHPTYRKIAELPLGRAGRQAPPAGGANARCSPRSRRTKNPIATTLMTPLGPDVPARRPA